MGFNYTLHAQAMPSATISGMKLLQETVEISLKSAEPFYAGNNIFTLYIGNKGFNLYRQEDIEGKGLIVFLILKKEFDQLKNGANIFIGYGDKPSEESLESLCETLPNMYHYLGAFQPEKLIK